MLPLAILLKRSDGTHSFSNGTVFPLPVELRTPAREREYLAISKRGWTGCEFGYQAYATHTSGGELIVLPGLIISGMSVRRKFTGYNRTFQKSEIEHTAAGIAEFFDLAADSVRGSVNTLIHDLRNISRAIQSAGDEARRLAVYSTNDQLPRRIEDVMAAQAMLRMRTDILDVVGNPAALTQLEYFRPYGKVDKVIQAFRARAREDGKYIHLAGSSFSQIQGSNFFELIPYLLLDNAIKYCPTGTSVDVTLHEKDLITIEVSSLGPKILRDEYEAIFVKGFRAASTKAHKASGSGLGLSILKQIVEDAFAGEVTVQQEEETFLEKEQPVFRTKFLIKLPIAKKQQPYDVTRYRP